MKFQYRITYFQLDKYGIRDTRKPRIGYVHARSIDEARKNAKTKYGSVEIISIS